MCDIPKLKLQQLLRESFPLINSPPDVQTRKLASLWAGMGSIIKVQTLDGPDYKGIGMVVKSIRMPRGHDLSVGDSRKALSYEVEAVFYSKFSQELIEEASYSIVPTCLHVDRKEKEGAIYICMSELPKGSLSCHRLDECKAAIVAIARFHAQWWGSRADIAVAQGLQSQGGYWYLDTRRDEYESISNRGWIGRLKKAAEGLDSRLKADPSQCVIHGDLKCCNMAIEHDLSLVSFCDFQYCGKACAMKDIAYFFIVSVDNIDEELENTLLIFYYEELCRLLLIRGPIDITLPTLEAFQNSLLIAYADLCRWMAGWGFWGNVSFLETRVQSLLRVLDGGTELQSSDLYTAAVFHTFPVGRS